MRPINIGKLNKRITFLLPGEGEDSVGQTVPEWEKYRTVWATVKALRGGEYWEAQKIRPEVTYKITTRYIEGITPDMMILFHDQKFEILSVIDVEEENYMLEIQCKEYVGDQIAEL